MMHTLSAGLKLSPFSATDNGNSCLLKHRNEAICSQLHCQCWKLCARTDGRVSGTIQNAQERSRCGNTMHILAGLEAETQLKETEPLQGAIRFRPCIDIHQGKVKQIVGSTLRDLAPANGANTSGGSAEKDSLITNFESTISSSEYAEMYRRDELLGGHIIMLGADSASQEAALAAIRAYPGGLQVGGGINSENAGQYLDVGASHVIVTSYVFREGTVDEDRLRELVQAVGRQRLVLDLSCRKKDGQYRVVTDRWQRFSDVVLSQQSLDELAKSADEFLVHGVDVEGMRLGIDEELVELLGRWSSIPVTYAGGARTLEDLERVRSAGNGRVDITVGSALDIFGGDLPYKEVVNWHWQQQQQLH